MKRLLGISCVAFWLPGLAYADDAIASPATGIAARVVLFAFGLFFAAYWAYEAFCRRAVTLGSQPTLPRYMTRRSQFWIGATFFTGISLVFYSILAYFHREALPGVKLFDPDLYKMFEPMLNGDNPSYLLVIIFISAVYLSLLRLERDWNVLLLLRNVIQSWASIPYQAATLMTKAHDTLVVPPTAISGIVGNTATPYVDASDFAKDRQSLDRIWAEASYMRLWLEERQAEGVDTTFFEEPSFAWASLRDEYKNAALRLRPLKRGEAHDEELFADAYHAVEEVRTHLCRLVACFLVFKNETQQDVFAAARSFGLAIEALPTENPLRYAIIFLLTLALSVYVGVYASALGFDLYDGKPLLIAIGQDPDYVLRWVGYALANYGVPLCVVLSLKYLGWCARRRSTSSYLIIYCWVFVIAFAAAPPSLAAAVELLATSLPQGTTFLGLVMRETKWAWGPAFIAVYMVYYIDRQIDQCLPNIDADGRSPLVRAVQAVLYAFFVTIVLIPPMATIQARPDGLWGTAKLQGVALGTTLLMMLSLCLVAQFGLRKLDDAAALAPSPSRKAAA